MKNEEQAYLWGWAKSWSAYLYTRIISCKHDLIAWMRESGMLLLQLEGRTTRFSASSNSIDSSSAGPYQV